MRLQLLSRRAGIRWLSSRFDFYRHLQTTGQKMYNPEMFEMLQVGWLNMSAVGCAVPIDPHMVSDGLDIGLNEADTSPKPNVSRAARGTRAAHAAQVPRTHAHHASDACDTHDVREMRINA